MNQIIDYKFGVEEEFALVTADFAISNDVKRLIDLVPPELAETQIKSDLHYCIVEISTGICTDIEVAYDELARLRIIAAEAASKLEMRLLPVGVHPTSPMNAGKLVTTDRYLRLIKSGGLRGDGVHYGQHVHVSIDNVQERIDTCNRLRWFIPAIIAISVNSPLYQGCFTGNKSTRMNFYEPVCSSGPPPVFRNWQDVERQIDKLAYSGVEELRDIYADIRLRESIPTLEVRCIDTQLTVRNTIETAAFIRSLTRKLHQDSGNKFSATIHEEDLHVNRRLAIKEGLNGDFHFNGKTINRVEYISSIIDWLLVDNPEESTFLESLRARVGQAETGADFQLGSIADDGLSREKLFDGLIDKYFEGIRAEVKL